jgi:uncharacterized membrane protein
MVVLIGVAMLTVVLSWTVLSMVFTLRYADQHCGTGAGMIVGGSVKSHCRPDSLIIDPYGAQG